MVAYENFYQGADFLIPSYNPVGYQVEASDIGMTLDGRTANQLQDLSTSLHAGQKVIEVQGADPRILESIPRQHFKEMKRQMKLAGVQPSIHGPVVEASGFGQQGWTEVGRLGSEKQLTSAVLRSHELDPKGNISVTLHSSALPELMERAKVKEKGKEGEKIGLIYVIDPRTGQYTTIKPEKKFFPEAGVFKPEGKEEFNVEAEIEKFNKNKWVQSLSGVNRYADYGESEISKIFRKGEMEGGEPPSEERKEEILSIIKKGEIENLKDENMKRFAKDIQRQINHGEIYLRDAYQNMKGLFDVAYTSSTGADKEELKGFAEDIAPIVTSEMENNPEKLKEFGDIIEKGLKILGRLKKTPELVVPLNDFIIEKSAETFANVAENAHDEFGKTAPIINIENPPAGMGLSRAEDLKELVKKSRKTLAQNLVKHKGMGNSEAKQVAEKIIGATWDVGHINMLRKKGYSEKDIIKQTEIIAPYVKHVHLSDNFGYEHTELPMGMGNVPIKEIMARLGEKGFKGKKIIEAVDWYQHFQDVPGQAARGGGHAFSQTMQAFGSPIYAMKAGPSWSQVPGFAAYTFAAGQGAINPPVSQQMYGLGFSSLPQELGGPIGGDQSRFSGTPKQ